MTGKVLVTGLVAVFILAASSRVDGQTTETSVAIAFSYPNVTERVCCELRTRPYYVERERRYAARAIEADVRIYWTKDLSVIVGAAFGLGGNATTTFERPAISPKLVPPFLSTSYRASQTVTRDGFQLWLTQAVDIAPSRRFRPWIGGGIAFQNVREDFVDVLADFDRPTDTRTVTSSGPRQSFLPIVFAGGLRFYPAERFFLSAEGRANVYFRMDDPYPLITWRVGAGVRF